MLLLLFSFFFLLLFLFACLLLLLFGLLFLFVAFFFVYLLFYQYGCDTSMGIYILILFLLLLLLLLFRKEDCASIHTKRFLKEWCYAEVLIKMLCKKGEALFGDLVTQKQEGFKKCGLRKFHCTSYVQNYPTHYITHLSLILIKSHHSRKRFSVFLLLIC